MIDLSCCLPPKWTYLAFLRCKLNKTVGLEIDDTSGSFKAPNSLNQLKSVRSEDFSNTIGQWNSLPKRFPLGLAATPLSLLSLPYAKCHGAWDLFVSAMTSPQ